MAPASATRCTARCRSGAPGCRSSRWGRCWTRLRMLDALGEAVRATLPLALFLTAALSISADAERQGLADLAAARLAAWGRGDARLLYGLVCLATLVLTAEIGRAHV